MRNQSEKSSPTHGQLRCRDRPSVADDRAASGSRTLINPTAIAELFEAASVPPDVLKFVTCDRSNVKDVARQTESTSHPAVPERQKCPSSDDLRLIRWLAKGGSSSSWVRV